MKKLVLVLLICILVVGLGGCGSLTYVININEYIDNNLKVECQIYRYPISSTFKKDKMAMIVCDVFTTGEKVHLLPEYIRVMGDNFVIDRSEIDFLDVYYITHTNKYYIDIDLSYLEKGQYFAIVYAFHGDLKAFGNFIPVTFGLSAPYHFEVK